MKGVSIEKIFGIDNTPLNYREGVISGFGGFLGIAGVYLVSSLFFYDHITKIIIVASMGSSAVLLFAAPLSSLTQPWNVLGGHLISAFIGVTCAKYISVELIAAAASVGVSIGVMYYARCVHPPAGATTLFAVIGGPSIHSLGYTFVFAPILINAVVIIIVALLFNLLFSWRRYPACIATTYPSPENN